MLLNIQQIKDNYILTLKRVDEEQIFIVAAMNESRNCLEDFNHAYKDIIVFLKEYKIHILHERIFGSEAYYKEIDNIRSDLLEQKEMKTSPYTYLEGSPCWGEGIAGIHMHGVILSKEASVRMVVSEDQNVGYIWDNGKEEHLILHSMKSDSSFEKDKYQDFTSMFEKTQNILESNGFHFSHVIRTWIYFNNILSEYDLFNKARTDFFRNIGIRPDKDRIPASTGIGCGNPEHQTAVMDVLAVKPKYDNTELNIKDETGVEQKAAFRYGSAFSRAIILEKRNYRQIFLSGTASIDQSGETIHKDNIERQIDYTFKVIMSLVDVKDLTLEHMCESTVFLKKQEFYPIYQDYMKKRGWEYLPIIATLAHVCRDELLFEADAAFIT